MVLGVYIKQCVYVCVCVCVCVCVYQYFLNPILYKHKYVNKT